MDDLPCRFAMPSWPADAVMEMCNCSIWDRNCCGNVTRAPLYTVHLYGYKGKVHWEFWEAPVIRYYPIHFPWGDRILTIVMVGTGPKGFEGELVKLLLHRKTDIPLEKRSEISSKSNKRVKGQVFSGIGTAIPHRWVHSMNFFMRFQMFLSKLVCLSLDVIISVVLGV